MKKRSYYDIKKLFLGIVLTLISSCTQITPPPPANTEIVGEIHVIPLPNSVERSPGEFVLTPETKISVHDEAGAKLAAALNDLLFVSFGFKLTVINKGKEANSIIFLPIAGNVIQEPEGYRLKIEPNFIYIAGTEKGMFYAVQSLMQLPSPDLRIPAAEISDSPRFAYRGLHLDVARHFMPIEFVKKFIDLMSKYKFNHFHWHLTDDQGWRIEIKKYPKLTEIGSKRPETVVGKNYRPFFGDGKPVEGYYTQQEISDVVEFARSRYVTVIPEIDLPGHASAALAAYPQMGCKENYPYQVKKTWGGFPDIYCPTELTFGFLEDVLSEVMGLFPDSPYLHIGGDEVNTDHWKQSKLVQDLKRQNGLRTERDVQSWFIRRIEKFVNSRGKGIIGWDDILGDGIEPSTTIMAWQSTERGIQAAMSGHPVIMAVSDKTYFDHPQGDPKFEPLSLGPQITLEDVYRYDPAPKNLNPDAAKLIVGGQGCVWTEFIKTPRDVEYMTFPRAIALAEVLWSKQQKKNFMEFSSRLYREFPKLEAANVHYRIPKPIGLREIQINDDERTLVELKLPVQNGKILYTLNGQNPDEKANLYQKPFLINLKPNGSVELRAKVINSEGRESQVFVSKYKRPTIADNTPLR